LPEDYVQVPPDSTGKKMHTLSESVGTNTVETQVVKVADASAPTQYQGVRADGDAQISMEDLALAIRYLAECIARPIWYEPTSGLLRVDTSATTLPTLTNIQQLGTYTIKESLLNPTHEAAWSQQVRARIT
jgi:hypothetical protein